MRLAVLVFLPFDPDSFEFKFDEMIICTRGMVGFDNDGVGRHGCFPVLSPFGSRLIKFVRPA